MTATTTGFAGFRPAAFAFFRELQDNNDPALADMLPVGLELRLNQRDEFGPVGSKCERRRQHSCEADEA